MEDRKNKEIVLSFWKIEMNKKMVSMLMIIAVVRFCSIANASFITNGYFRSWTAGTPDGWTLGSEPYTESTLLNGSSSVRLTCATGYNSSVYYMKQIFSETLSGNFYISVDLAFENASDGREFSFALKNISTAGVINIKYEAPNLSLYNGSAWVNISTSGIMTAGNFDVSTVHPYRIIIQGNLQANYSVKIIDLGSDTVILNVTGLNYYQNRVSANILDFDLSRGTNEILVDNVLVMSEPICDNLLVYDNAMGQFLNPIMSSDISGPEGKPDCEVNLYDLAVLVSQWLQSNDPKNEG